MVDSVAGEYASTYGEITPAGFRALARRVGLGAQDVFVDLGSGVGRAVVQAALENGVRRSAGVELAASRHERAARCAPPRPRPGPAPAPPRPRPGLCLAKQLARF
jgi:hypothetical protein